MALIPATSTTEVHERDVARADIGGRVTAGDGRDHELGHADGQTAHGGRDQGRPAAAADPDHTEDSTGLMLAAQVAFQRLAHRGDGLAPVGSRNEAVRAPSVG